MSQNVVRALPKAICAHSFTSVVTTRRLKPPHRPSSRSRGRSRAARFQPTRRPTGPPYSILPNRVPTSLVSVPATSYVRPSCSYRHGRGRAALRAIQSAINARPIASTAVHSAGSNTASEPGSPSLACRNAASNAVWTSRLFSSILVVIGALSSRIVVARNAIIRGEKGAVYAQTGKNHTGSRCLTHADQELHPSRTRTHMQGNHIESRRSFLRP